MNKKLILALALAGLSSIAVAQSSAPTVAINTAPAATPVAVKPTDSAAAKPQVLDPVASAAQTAKGSFDTVNPFNGKPMKLETLQRELELARYKSQLLEEQLKQTSAEEEIKNIPVRKAVESAQARTQEKKEVAALKDIERQMTASARAANPDEGKPAPVKKSKKALAKEKEEAEAAAAKAREEAAARAAAIPPATLLSVISVGGKNSAVLDIQGGILTVADGESSPVGKVKVIDGQNVNIGGRSYKVHDQTIGRFVVSDTKPTSNLQGSGPAVGTSVASSNVASLPPAIPANSSATLPPPPLPAGVSSGLGSPLAALGSTTPLPGGNVVKPKSNAYPGEPLPVSPK